MVSFTVILSPYGSYCRGVVPRGLGPPLHLKKSRRVADALSVPATAKRPSAKARLDARLPARRGGLRGKSVFAVFEQKSGFSYRKDSRQEMTALGISKEPAPLSHSC